MQDSQVMVTETDASDIGRDGFEKAQIGPPLVQPQAPCFDEQY